MEKASYRQAQSAAGHPVTRIGRRAPSAPVFGIVSHIMHFSLHDGPGIRTTVFLKGCPLRCWWCHNPETQEYRPSLLVTEDRCRRCGACVTACPLGALTWADDRPVLTGACDRCGACADACAAEARVMIGQSLSVDEVMAEIEKDRVFHDESGGGVTFSGGEPLARPRFLETLLDTCRARGVHTAIDTCGFAPREIALRLGSRADLILYDLKFIDSARHAKYTGVPNHRILENLRALLAAGQSLVVRVPIIPGINDTDSDILALRDFLATLPLRRLELLPYHQTGAAKYRRLGWPYRLNELKPPTAARMHELAAVFAHTDRSVTIGGPA